MNYYLLKIGGSDQTGNIKTGHELITKIRSSENANISGPIKKKTVFSLTSPIVTTDKGQKLGKSAGNAIWLDPALFSPFELYQFFVNTPDQMVQIYLKMFTFLPLGEIDDIMDKQQVRFFEFQFQVERYFFLSNKLFLLFFF